MGREIFGQSPNISIVKTHSDLNPILPLFSEPFLPIFVCFVLVKSVQWGSQCLRRLIRQWAPVPAEKLAASKFPFSSLVTSDASVGITPLDLQLMFASSSSMYHDRETRELGMPFPIFFRWLDG